MPVFPGSEKPLIGPFNTIKTDGFNELIFHFSSHTGTHIDAPYHLLPDGKSITDLPAEHFTGKAIKLNLGKETNTLIQELNQKAEPFGKIDFVLLQTGFDKLWGTDAYFGNFPVPSAQLIKAIIELKPKGIGIDAISIDPIDSKDLENHHLILSTNAIIIENLTQLELLPDKPFDFFCFPLKIKEGDGSPVRAVADIQ
jgi:arylformamidase